jgi:alginate O-acetyltransferase complex protein AlgI
MVPQFEDRRIYRPHADNLARGSAIFAVGLFKKVWVADHFAGLSDTFFTAAAAGHPFHFVDAWGGALAYSLQLYFDFSAYCDMAIGISLMFNVRLPLNFNSPYKATSIIDFWRRWHITLSEFLRDYLYVPLGGNRRGAARRYLNLGITMVLGGLWHGANWTFVVWGALHGAYLVANHAWRALLQRLGIRLGPGWKWPAMAVTFTLVVFAWVPFRAETMGRAMDVWRLMFGAGTVPSALLGDPRQWLSLAVGVGIVWFLPNLQQWAGYADPAGSEPPASPSARTAWSPSLRWGLLCGLMAALALSNLGKESPFLYFQF